MIQRYEPKQWENAIGEPFVKMAEEAGGEYVSYYDHMLEVTRLQERISELQSGGSNFYGDV